MWILFSSPEVCILAAVLTVSPNNWKRALAPRRTPAVTWPLWSPTRAFKSPVPGPNACLQNPTNHRVSNLIGRNSTLRLCPPSITYHFKIFNNFGHSVKTVLGESRHSNCMVASLLGNSAYRYIWIPDCFDFENTHICTCEYISKCVRYRVYSGLAWYKSYRMLTNRIKCVVQVFQKKEHLSRLSFRAPSCEYKERDMVRAWQSPPQMQT